MLKVSQYFREKSFVDVMLITTPRKKLRDDAVPTEKLSPSEGDHVQEGATEESLGSDNPESGSNADHNDSGHGSPGTDCGHGLPDINNDIIDFINALISQPLSEKNFAEVFERLAKAKAEVTGDIEELLKEQNAETSQGAATDKVKTDYLQEIKYLKRERDHYFVNWVASVKREALWKRGCHMYKTRAEYAESKLRFVYREKEGIVLRLREIFTPGKVNMLLNPGKRTTWNLEDIAGAISILALTAKSYEYLMAVLKIPLPGLTTLRR
ncbi:uncharacterized protein LOC117168031 [Belonocnema kinseyi]|uniref:uncharacterized protein LOC117168031 n=1 Tax=Belonocnema kinseyi TaxID=2817044 RepID=UPI00143D1DC8|nr:uncharacterized protein LOC117168031 [Belonocnema kinseyi]XP_033209249.1 uncharacterized protein LOC117168031 [Belonocnema kinseyi]